MEENIDNSISRQSAIDIAVFECGEWIGLAREISKQLRQLPSAEPQIIRCKDCKYRDKYGCCTHWKGLAIGDIPIATDDNDFCSRAERRTG